MNEDEEPREDTYHYEGGIKSYAEFILNQKKNLFMTNLFIFISQRDIEVEIATQYNSGYATNYLMRIISTHMKVVHT